MKTPARAPLTPEAAEPSPPAETRRAAIRDDHSDAPVFEDPFVAFAEWGEPADEADYAGL